MNTREVSLPEMLDARDRRVQRQQELLGKYRKTVLSFTMNIAGPVKNNDLILRGFRAGQRLLAEEIQMAGIPVLEQTETTAITGNEAMYVLDADPERVKRITVQIEDNAPAGRLYDMDVLEASGRQVSRQQLGLPSRGCLICGGPAKICSSRRIHTVPQLQKKTRQLLCEAFREEDARTAAQLAVRCLLYEVCVTPKPGLVDRQNSGSHTDMDIFTFMRSASVLFPYFETCTKIGMDTGHLAATETFSRLRWPGKRAECVMLTVTGGVNTHKGAVFSMGILCGAAGRIPREHWGDSERILRECAAMTEGITERECAGVTPETARTKGQMLYALHGMTGVRGQAERGFPAVLEAGLPALEQALEEGCPEDEAGANALLSIIATGEDTNIAARSDYDVLQEVSGHVRELRKQNGLVGREVLEQLDREFIRRNLSPGGSADLLALTWFLHFLKEEAK